MSIRLSDAAMYMLSGDVGLRRALSGSSIVLFTGTQPTSANYSSGSSQPIISFTDSDGVLTNCVDATWVVNFSAITGTADVTSVKVGGLELLAMTISGTDATILASDVAEDINENYKNIGYTATASSGDLIVKAPFKSGSNQNGMSLVVSTAGSITVAYQDAALHNGSVYSAGVDSINGLEFSIPQDGVLMTPQQDIYYISQKSGQTWSGKNGFGPATASSDAVYSGITDLQTYTAGWGRICSSTGDSGLDETSGVNGYVRVDFSVGSSNSDLIIQPSPSFYVNTTVGNEVTTTIQKFILKIKKNMG